MTPLILIALLGFGVALTAGSSSDDTSDATPDTLPEEPQEPDTFNTPGLNTEGFSQQIIDLSGLVTTNGTDADDFVQANSEDGTSYNGLGGNDLLRGTADMDSLFGGDGDDTIVTGAGNDFALGSRGDDLIFLGDGDDQSSQFTPDHIGNDTIVGGAGADIIHDNIGSN